MNIYALKDTCTGRFYPPFYAESDVAAIAQIKENLFSPSGIQLARLADQLEIYYLGKIDFEKGLIFSNTAWHDYEENSLNPDTNYLHKDELEQIVTNRLICFVSEIVEQLPKQLLSPELTHEDLKRVYAEIKDLQTQLLQLGEAYNTHKHTKKGAFLIDDQKKF